jgi:hypothetical protein
MLEMDVNENALKRKISPPVEPEHLQHGGQMDMQPPKMASTREKIKINQGREQEHQTSLRSLSNAKGTFVAKPTSASTHNVQHQQPTYSSSTQNKIHQPVFAQQNASRKRPLENSTSNSFSDGPMVDSCFILKIEPTFR